MSPKRQLEMIIPPRFPMRGVDVKLEPPGNGEQISRECHTIGFWDGGGGCGCNGWAKRRCFREQETQTDPWPCIEKSALKVEPESPRKCQNGVVLTPAMRVGVPEIEQLKELTKDDVKCQ